MTASESKWITPEALRASLDSASPPGVLHTLPQSHFVRCRIPGAANACVYEVTFLEQAAAAIDDKHTPIVVYGSRDTSSDAPTAAEKLIAAGYSDVTVLEGGLAAWMAAGFPVEGDDPVPTSDFETTAALREGTYRVDPSVSVIEWTGRNPNGKHFGTVALATGDIALTADGIGGRFEIDMTAIQNVDLAGDELYPVLIAHLESDDFFWTRRFPKAVFTIRTGRPVPSPTLTLPNFIITGTLELRGVGADIEFPASVTPTVEGGIAAEAHFDIDRTHWKIIYGSSRFFDHLGMHVVFDPISIAMRLAAAPV